MLKPKLLCRCRTFENTRREKLSQYFQLVNYNSDYEYKSSEYDAVLEDWNDTFFHWRYNNNLIPQAKWYDKFVYNGSKFIIDHSYDSYVNESSYFENNNTYVLRSKNWIWINENWLYRKAGYKDVLLRNVPSPDPTKFFLLLMNLERAHRTEILNRSTKYLDDSIYSYVARGIILDNELLNDRGYIKNQWAFYPQRYSNTYFSLVAETTTNLIRPRDLSPNKPIFISEKSFKPFAFKHPFITYGTANTLQYLKSIGFETFDHVINETYDSILDPYERLTAIMIEVDNLYKEYKEGKQLFKDALSQEKLEHNFNRFYDDALVDQMYVNEVINPMLEFINA